MLAPTSIVEDLLVERSRIAREWRSHIEGASPPAAPGPTQAHRTLAASLL
mgnify:CR=1 FL=1|jgi:hypothetical protein